MTTAIARPEDQPGVVTALMQAVESKDPRMLELILNAREKWQADESRGLFNAAVVKFQQRVGIIAKLDKAYDKLYARMDRIWREIRPLLDECGLAVTWESVRTTADGCVLDGHLRHAAGHAQPLHHEIPMPDLLKGQNAAQRAGSAETYAKRYALCAALGIQTGDDDNGAMGKQLPRANAQAVEEMRATLKANNRDEAKACAYVGIQTLDEANAEQLLKIATTMARPAAKPAQDACAHVPTRAECEQLIRAALPGKRAKALAHFDLTDEGWPEAGDALVAQVAAYLVK